MNKFRIAVLFVVALFMAPVCAMAADGGSAMSLTTIGAGIIMLGAGYGIGIIGSRAVDAMSRQPEVAGSIQIAMIISAALIEGVTFYALTICLMQ